jgi:sugar O-acyltransferase (sialic acid O-acetyltransferase NeuD family)
MKKINIIGYSGHSYLCIETAQKMGYIINEYYDSEEKENNPYNLTYLGSENLIENVKNALFVSIGDNYIRKKVYIKFKNEKKAEFVTLIHPSANISNFTKIGENSFVSKNVVVNPMSTIGNNVIINTNAIIEHDCIIGDNSHIAPSTVLLGNVKIGSDCFIGANSTINPGITICDNVIIGSGSIVIKDIINSGTYIGSPVKKLIK